MVVTLYFIEYAHATEVAKFPIFTQMLERIVSVYNKYYISKFYVVTIIKLLALIAISFWSNLVFSQPVTKKMLVHKLTNNGTKYWYKCGSLTKKDRMEGDKRFLFSLSDKKFTIETCSNLLKWVKTSVYNWDILPETDSTPTGYHHFLLKIANKFSRFRFDSQLEKLYVILPNKKEETCLY